MATNTYVALDKVTVSGTSTPSITFNSIPQTYTDLVIIVQAGATVSTQELKVVLNNDTTTNYSNTIIWGNGSIAGSVRRTNTTGWILDYQGGLTTDVAQNITRINIMNYANTTTFKTAVVRADSTSISPEAMVCLWRKTPEAINTVKIECLTGNFASGSTFSLYGIKAQATESSPKATGGYVYSDSSYYYHAFPFTSAFVPNQTLSCDVLVVAGGGGGGWAGGGGGAGGYRYLTSQSFSATSYTVTVGSGGNGGTSGSKNGVSGSNSSISSISATGGGGGGGYSGVAGYPASGGSGGGAGADPGSGYQTGASGNAGGYTPVEGYAGGNAVLGASYSGGGGGATAAGSAGNATIGGAGGAGSNALSSWATVTLTGHNGYYAGGGGGHRAIGGLGGGGIGGYTGTAGEVDGRVSTGGGGGAGGANGTNGGNGGSGIVIVRYAK